MRHALIATNLTAKRVVDGVAKLLSKTDVNMLASKRKEAEVRGADDQLGAEGGRTVADQLPHLINLVHLDLRGTWWSWHAE